MKGKNEEHKNMERGRKGERKKDGRTCGHGEGFPVHNMVFGLWWDHMQWILNAWC